MYFKSITGKLRNLDENLFAEYSSRVREVLDLQPTNMEDGSIRLPKNQKMSPETLKNACKDLLASLILEETAIKIALSCVNKKALCSRVFASAPRIKQHANNRMALIEDTLPLPPLLQLRSKSYLEQLYSDRQLSVREIASLTNLSHSVVLAAMERFGIPQNGNGHKRQGQIPFGFNYIDYKIVKNKEEQNVIRMIRQLRASGSSLREIANEMNQKLIPTKNSGIWQANTVKKILSRV